MPLAQPTQTAPANHPPGWRGPPPPSFRDPSSPPSVFPFIFFVAIGAWLLFVLLSVATRRRRQDKHDDEEPPNHGSGPAWYVPGPTERTPLWVTEPHPPPPPYDGGHHHHPPPTHDPHPPTHNPPPPETVPDTGHSHH